VNKNKLTFDVRLEIGNCDTRVRTLPDAEDIYAVIGGREHAVVVPRRLVRDRVILPVDFREASSGFPEGFAVVFAQKLVVDPKVRASSRSIDRPRLLKKHNVILIAHTMLK
tara:strand:- start:224 stop:556 length:333 start_codon:yes stop_codon:yes gene_type:complete